MRIWEGHYDLSDLIVFEPPGDDLISLPIAIHLFYLDYNRNDLWDDASIDNRYNFGTSDDIPVSGKW